ncbi:hypothetical protein XPA_000376 [Xanthoria parietina]
MAIFIPATSTDFAVDEKNTNDPSFRNRSRLLQVPVRPLDPMFTEGQVVEQSMQSCLSVMNSPHAFEVSIIMLSIYRPCFSCMIVSWTSHCLSLTLAAAVLSVRSRPRLHREARLFSHRRKFLKVSVAQLAGLTAQP